MSDGAGAFHQATGRGLEDTSGADQRRYRAYQLELIAPHCGPSVLEVGAGLGEFAAQFSGLARHVVTDVDPDAVSALAARFADRPEVEARRLDLAAGPAGMGDDPDVPGCERTDRRHPDLVLPQVGRDHRIQVHPQNAGLFLHHGHDLDDRAVERDSLRTVPLESDRSSPRIVPLP